MLSNSWSAEAAVVAILVPFVAERASRDGRDVALMDGCGLCGAMKPAHDVAVSNLRRPPGAAVERERTRVHVPERIGLLEEGVFVRIADDRKTMRFAAAR